MKLPRLKTKPYPGEKIFETDLAKAAGYFKCLYVKIPDAIKNRNSLVKKKNGAYTMIEAKRPCDAVIVSKTGNYLVECKFDDGTLKKHQKELSVLANEINDSFYVIRKRMNLHRKNPLPHAMYSIEKHPLEGKKRVIMKSQKIEDIFKFFNAKKVLDEDS